MYFALDVIAISLLMCAFICSENGTKSWACIAVLFVYIVSMRFESSGLYAEAVDSLGYYVTQSFFEVMAVALLLAIPSREGVLVMWLCLTAVIVNILSWGIESTGFYMGNVANGVMWLLFAAQLAVLFSKDLTDVTYGYFTKHSLVRYMHFSHYKVSTKSSTKG